MLKLEPWIQLLLLCLRCPNQVNLKEIQILALFRIKRKKNYNQLRESQDCHKIYVLASTISIQDSIQNFIKPQSHKKNSYPTIFNILSKFHKNGSYIQTITFYVTMMKPVLQLKKVFRNAFIQEYFYLKLSCNNRASKVLPFLQNLF